MKNILFGLLFLLFLQAGFAQVSLTIAKRTGNTLYNVLDKNTGETVSFTKTAVYEDGTKMNLVKCDSIIYIKYVNEYFKRNYEGAPNIKWFGCKTESVNNHIIINKILEKYKTAYIPDGIYRFSGTIVLPDSASLKGNGKNAVLQLVSTKPCTGISMSRATTLNGFVLDCAKTDMDTSPAVLVNSWNDVGSLLDELKIQNISIKGNNPRLQGVAIQLAIENEPGKAYSVIAFCRFNDIDIYGFRDGIVCSVDYSKGKNISYINANIFQNIIIHKCLRPVRLLNNAAAADIKSGKSSIASNIFAGFIVQHVVGDYPAFYLDGGMMNTINAQIVDWPGNYAESTVKSDLNMFNFLPDYKDKIKVNRQ